MRRQFLVLAAFGSAAALAAAGDDKQVSLIIYNKDAAFHRRNLAGKLESGTENSGGNQT